MKFVYNPFILTGLSDKKINKKVDINVEDNLNDIFSVFQYLSNHNTGTDLDIAHVHNFLKYQPENMRDFYRTILTKSLKLGCDAATFNKVWGVGFIPTFDVQLANKYFEMPQKVGGKDFTITLKIDGQRCIALKENDVVSLFSRQGQPINGLIDVENEIRNIPCDNFVLDGELTLLNGDGIPSAEQYKQTLKVTRKDGEKHDIKLLAFDILDLEEFKTKTCKHTYTQRRNRLSRLDSDIIMTYVEILPVLYSGSDTSKIAEILDRVRSDDQEGCMININDAMYEFKRTSNLLKCKVMQDADLMVTDVYEGIGRNIGKLGGVEVMFIHKDNYYKCNCGSGFSDSERVLYWEHPELIIGKIATIQFFEISANDNGEYGLRFPIWTKRIRDDKTEISMN